MAGLRSRLTAPLKTALKRRLAGENVDPLITRRDRRRLRWLVQEGTEPTARFRALRALSELQDPDAAPLFLARIEAEPGSLPPAEVRTAAQGVGRLLWGDAAPGLRRLLSPDRPVGVQLAAARALVTLGGDEHWAALRAWAVAVEDRWPLFPDDRDCARCPKREPPGTFTIVQVVQTLYADKGPRWWSSKASSWLASDQPAPRMASDKGADKVVAQEHRHALEKKALDDDRFAATVRHLGTFGLDRDFPLLHGLRSRGLPALQALGLHGDPRSIPALRLALEGDGLSDAARAAGRLGWPALASDLAGAWGRASSSEERQNLAWALGEVGGEAAVAALVERVRSKDDPLVPGELRWIALGLKRCGVLGREAIRGSVAIARAGGGERDRVRQVAELAGIH